MNVLGTDGEIGKISSPINSALALFRQVLIYNPDSPPAAMAVFTNGAFDHKTPEKFSSLLATCRMPHAYIFEDEDYTELKQKVIDPICSYLTKYVSTLETGNPKVTFKYEDDVVFESTNKVPAESFVLSWDRDRLVLGSDRLWFNNFASELQYMIQNRLDIWRAYPKSRAIGIGMVEKGAKSAWKLDKGARPSSYIKVGSRMVVKVQPTMIDIAPAESRYQAVYAYLAAHYLQEFMGNTIEGYTIHDYVGLVNLILAGINGFGDTPTVKHFSSTDNQTTIDHSIGFGFTMANRYMWGIHKDGKVDVDSWIAYFKFCLLLGVASSRIRVPTQEYEVVKVANADHTVWDRFHRATSSNIPKFGNFGNMVLLMRRNSFTHDNRKQHPWPCIVDYSLEAKGNITEKSLIQHANEYVELPKFKPVTFEPVTIEQGRFPMNFIDYTSMQQRFITMRPMNDAQIIETDMTERQTIRWMFDMHNVVTNSLPDDERKLFWLIGLLSNGESVLDQGYLVDVGYQIFKPIKVRYYTSSFGEIGVAKEKSETNLEQIPKPGAGAGLPTQEMNPREGTDGRIDKQPPTPPPTVEEPKVEEKPSGEIVEKK